MLKTKEEFIIKLSEFVKELEEYSLTDDKQWSVKGFIDIYKNLYTISSDTKIISKIIEIHIFPKILQFAEENSYKVVLAEHQNWYPDISFVHSSNPSIKFAVDIKTTYRSPDYPGHCNGFTLGSHGEYFINRTSEKNIQFPYNQYLAHICLGVIYTRCDNSSIDETKIYKVNEIVKTKKNDDNSIGARSIQEVDKLISIASVVKDFHFFVKEKWEIASDSSGSGNTANIGSITKIDDILEGNGVFKNLGEKWFDEYWMNHGKIDILLPSKKTKKITKLSEYLSYRKESPMLAYPKAKRSKKANK